ncbi:hypothetical protein HUW51_15755 [Adhaeribacter swui]|uniref:Uncharacterized protein n=1 Tax=Adhaeribacter swui TaxID=2086471 RepID=A0A7G7GAC0_9BACT|nr:hypothetical protein [Adhaeribacter swui]QNF34104.1 hypothetical protein HUW51_15755 [Adhaeribacter swui]
MRNYFTSTAYWFLLLFGYACEQNNQKEITSSKPQPPPKALQSLTDSGTTSYQDTLLILDAFASQPFMVDSISTRTVQQLFHTNQVVKKPVINKFSAGQTDTIITIRKAHSYVELYRVSAEENKYFYQSALIRDSMRVFTHPLQIGLTKEQVKHLFPTLTAEKSIPDIIQISNDTGTDNIYLVFRNNKLSAVKFRPYLD